MGSAEVLREIFLTLGELSLVLLLLWFGAVIFQFLRGLIFGPPTPKKDERHE
jgi:hypothetical protein